MSAGSTPWGEGGEGRDGGGRRGRGGRGRRSQLRLSLAGASCVTLTMHGAGAAQEPSHTVGSQGKLKNQSHSSQEEQKEEEDQ